MPGLFTADDVRALIAKSRSQDPYEAARHAAYETAFTKASWSECTAVEKAVLLEDFPGQFPGARRDVAQELAAQYPQATQQIRKELAMPTTPVRKTAHTARPLSPRATATVRQIFEDVAAHQAAVSRAANAGFAAGAASVRKAKSNVDEDMVAVYDENRNLIGVVSQDAITALANTKSPTADADQAAQQQDMQAPQAGPAAAAQPQATAKAMSFGASARGQHQLGGKNPGGGYPVIHAGDAQPDSAELQKAALDAAITKAIAHGAALKKRFADPSTPAAERTAIGLQLDQIAGATLSATLGRRQPGAR